MSLFDDASLAMIPSAYKDGKLYSIKPTDGSGDFTFSRGSNLAATRVDENGLIEKGRENLFLQSNSFDTTWSPIGASVTSGQSGYDGSSDAWLLNKSSAGGFIQQSISSSGVQTYSIYAKAGSLNYMRLRVSGSLSALVYFDFTDGSIHNNDGFDATMVSVGGGWYRCSYSFVSTITAVQIYPADSTNSVSGASGSIYIQDAQLEAGLVATDYIETTTTTAQAGILEDMPRLDYSGGASCPSLLLEPQRSNLVTHSEYQGSGSGYNILGNSLTWNAGETTSPEGLEGAGAFLETAVTASHNLYRDVSVTSGSTYAISFYVKSIGGRNLKLSGGGTAFTFQGDIDLSDGTEIGNSWGGIDRVESVGNGWYRVISESLTAASTSGRVIFYGLDGNNTNYAGDTSKGFAIWGYQLEQGSYPTSYIPTYGTSQTRSKDSCVGSFDGDNIFDSNWTAMVEMIVPSQGFGGTSAGFGARLVEGSISSSDWSFIIVHRSGGLTIKTYSPPSDNNLTYTFGDTLKLIVRSDGYYFYNGVKYTLYGLSSNEPVEIGFGRAGQTDFSAGETAEIKQAVIFPTALTDSECIALTS